MRLYARAPHVGPEPNGFDTKMAPKRLAWGPFYLYACIIAA